MIHKLTVTPEVSPKELKRKARKLAMTGGFELELAPECAADLNAIADRFIQELENYREYEGSARFAASHPYRILLLIKAHEAASAELKQRIDQAFLGTSA